jgi:hypothetical protein
VRGALFQLFLVSDKINSLSSLVIDESDRHAANRIEAATDRMLYSVAEFIEHSFGISAADACGKYYMSDSLTRTKILPRRNAHDDEHSEASPTRALRPIAAHPTRAVAMRISYAFADIGERLIEGR